MTALAAAPAAEIHWETQQFASAVREVGAGMSARAAYQLVLFGRAVLVDLRPESQRQVEGEIDPALRPLVVGPDGTAGLSWLAADTRVLVLGRAEFAAPLGVPSTEIVGGVRAWRAAGLPLAA